MVYRAGQGTYISLLGPANAAPRCEDPQGANQVGEVRNDTRATAAVATGWTDSDKSYGRHTDTAREAHTSLIQYLHPSHPKV